MKSPHARVNSEPYEKWPLAAALDCSWPPPCGGSGSRSARQTPRDSAHTFTLSASVALQPQAFASLPRASPRERSTPSPSSSRMPCWTKRTRSTTNTAGSWTNTKGWCVRKSLQFVSSTIGGGGQVEEKSDEGQDKGGSSTGEESRDGLCTQP